MKYFGTDGIRQESEKFTSDFLTSIVIGLSDYANEKLKDKDFKVLIGGDTRESSEWILQDLSLALESLGIEYGNVGVLPTPAINYCFYEMGFDFAIDVTASHNPYTDNGIKIFERNESGYGQKLSEKGREIIENAITSKKSIPLTSPTDRENLHEEALELYKEHLLNYLEIANFEGLKIGMDCANGATSVIAGSLFEKLGAKVTLINADQNYGQKINLNSGSTHLESLTELVLKNNLDFGVAFDGDGDRVLMIDKNGNEIDGDEILALLTNFLNLNQLATTVMANQGLLNWAKDNDINLEITAVGDSNVAAAMLEKNIPLGGEQSGHIILPGETTGDGMLTALLVTKVISETKKSLNELAGIITKYPQIILNVPATESQKSALKERDEAKKLLLEFNEKMETVSGRLLVRPSGTENLIRITMWGNDKQEIENLANELSNELLKIL
ncbi:MAG: phosphoglucosamine mutase [Candidatus Saccharibacteria bacterium]|nr:phosphoglucosamine mutase [Candidatus Saccharibacteria bacterium]